MSFILLVKRILLSFPQFLYVGAVIWGQPKEILMIRCSEAEIYSAGTPFSYDILKILAVHFSFEFNNNNTFSVETIYLLDTRNID